MKEELIAAEMRNRQFIYDNAEIMRGLTIPKDYIMTEKGITKIVFGGNNRGIARIISNNSGLEYISVATNPIVISGEYYNLNTGIYKTQLICKVRGSWRRTPILANEDFYNEHKLVKLSNFGLPVNSTNAAEVVRFLDSFRAVNENAIPFKEGTNY